MHLCGNRRCYGRLVRQRPTSYQLTARRWTMSSAAWRCSRDPPSAPRRAGVGLAAASSRSRNATDALPIRVVEDQVGISGLAEKTRREHLVQNAGSKYLPPSFANHASP